MQRIGWWRIAAVLALAGPPAATAADPVFPYGAVYFRKSGPPEADWARDHATAAKLGANTFRHWFMWSAIEVAPGKYDWRDYDRMMDLAAQNGIKVVIAELVTAAPEWVFEKYPHAQFKASDESVTHSGVSGSSAVGGFPGLCLDNEDVKGLAEKFLTALVQRYRNHPATLGYDLWNENSYDGGSPQRMHCFCAATQRRFREWLRGRYGSLEELARTWHRYSYGEWDAVHPPRNFTGYPESLDWLEFRIDDAFRLLKWRADLFRRLDTKNKVVAHGVAGTLEALPNATNNEWRSAEMVDVWGLTWVASRKGSEPWKQFHAVDLARAGARGKPFWHAEAQAGPLWMQPQVTGRPREDGRITDEKDVRIWNLISCAGGATGILYPRWRPLLDGPLFGAFGPMGMDGSVTPRAEMAGSVARWANEHADVWRSRPVKGDIAIAFVPESELFNYVQQGSTAFYAQSVRGVYQGFFDNKVQADFVHIDHLSEYPVVYLPYPVMLKADSARKVAEYVERGGVLISEGLPGYFGDHGRVGTSQPNFGLDRVFGARESYVEFTPDLLEGLTLTIGGVRAPGRYFLQAYRPEGGNAAGSYADGRVAAVEHQFGKGRTLLMGTFPGGGYFLRPSEEGARFFASLLRWANVEPRLTVKGAGIQARLHTGAGGTYLWVVNPGRAAAAADIVLPSDFRGGEDIWGRRSVSVNGRNLRVEVGERDAAVVRLQ